MKARLLSIFLLSLITLFVNGQQTMMYNQYTFNKAGMNPAASGTDINSEYSFFAGVGRPWTGISNPPRQSFMNFSMTIRQPRSISLWQNAGIYVDNDLSGLFSQTNIYATYAVHKLLRKKLVLSFGVAAGLRRFTRSIGFFDSADPAVNRVSDLTLYPDIIPGVRAEDKKFFADLSLKQISILKLQDFKGRKIGGPSRLTPTLFMDYGRKIPLTAGILMMPSIAVNLPIIGPPVADGTLMFYLYNRVGCGIALRNFNFGTAIFQIRFLQNITAGFAYSYPLNSTRFVQGNTFEFMIGMIPTGMDVKVLDRHSVVRCPTLDY